PQAPAHGIDGRGAHVLVVEGWLDRSELDQAAALLRQGRYAQVLTSGGPIDPLTDVGGWRNYAWRAASYLQPLAPAGVSVIAVPAPDTPRDRTYLSAVRVRERLGEAAALPDAIDIFSAGAHGRRSRMVYRMAFGPQVEVGVISAANPSFTATRWWESSNGVKLVLGEAIALGWTACCFWPPAPPRHP
ncbi:MAG: hypothetical protein M3O01_03530, partial [Pseudomonadota bacterium]|nr:hypothetical protein [Pseudomonadota bacterium]